MKKYFLFFTALVILFNFCVFVFAKEVEKEEVIDASVQCFRNVEKIKLLIDEDSLANLFKGCYDLMVMELKYNEIEDMKKEIKRMKERVKEMEKNKKKEK